MDSESSGDPYAGDQELLAEGDVSKCRNITIIESKAGLGLRYLKNSKKWCTDNGVPFILKTKDKDRNEQDSDSGPEVSRKPLDRAQQNKKRRWKRFVPKTPSPPPDVVDVDMLSDRPHGESSPNESERAKKRLRKLSDQEVRVQNGRDCNVANRH